MLTPSAVVQWLNLTLQALIGVSSGHCFMSTTLQATLACPFVLLQACLLLSLESFYPPAHQLSLDMLKVTGQRGLIRLTPALVLVLTCTLLPPHSQRLSTANDEIVEVLLSKHQVLAALRFIRGIGGHDNISARKFLDAAKQTEDNMLFYTIFRFFEQRNQRLRGNPSFTPGGNTVVLARPG